MLSPATVELTPVTTAAVCTTFKVEVAVAATMAPLDDMATARTWWLPSVRPMVVMAPLAVHVCPLTSAASAPTAVQRFC